jgi:hypothetical protein
MVAHSVAVQGGTFFTPKIFKLAAPYIIISSNVGHMFLIYLSSSAALCIRVLVSPSRSRMFCNTLCFSKVAQASLKLEIGLRVSHTPLTVAKTAYNSNQSHCKTFIIFNIGRETKKNKNKTAVLRTCKATSGSSSSEIRDQLASTFNRKHYFSCFSSSLKSIISISLILY